MGIFSSEQVPNYTKAVINESGCTLVADDTSESALRIVSEWQACHAFPINTFQKNLRHKVKALNIKGAPYLRHAPDPTPSHVSIAPRVTEMGAIPPVRLPPDRAVLPQMMPPIAFLKLL